MNAIIEKTLNVLEAFDPLMGGLDAESFGEDVLDSMKEELGRTIIRWKCSTCGAVLNGTVKEFYDAKWMVAMISGSMDGRAGFIRLTACSECRDDKEATAKRMDLINILDHWNDSKSAGRGA